MALPRNHFTHLTGDQVTFDLDAFDDFVRAQGVKLVHYRAQRCPVGMVALGDSRRPHPHHEGCFNGFVYTKVGCVTASFTSNNKRQSQEDIGSSCSGA